MKPRVRGLPCSALPLLRLEREPRAAERAKTAAPAHLVPMKENPAATPAAGTDRSLQASPAATVLVRADEIPQAPEPPRVKARRHHAGSRREHGGRWWKLPCGSCPQPTPSEANHNQHRLTQPLPSGYRSKTKRPGGFGFAAPVRDPPTIDLNVFPSGWKDVNSLRGAKGSCPKFGR